MTYRAPTFRTALSVLAGLVAAGGTIAAIEAIGHARMRGDGIFAVALGGYFLGATVGTVVVSGLAGRTATRLIPVALALLALVNLRAFPHPAWFLPSAVLALALGWLIGSTVAASLPAGPARKGQS